MSLPVSSESEADGFQITRPPIGQMTLINADRDSIGFTALMRIVVIVVLGVAVVAPVPVPTFLARPKYIPNVASQSS